MSEVVGTIKISFPAKGQPTVEILGDLPARQYNALPVYLRRAVRKHRALMRRNIKKVDMSDKGKKLEELKEEEIQAQKVPEPQAGADELKISPPPVDVVMNPAPGGAKPEVEANDKDEQEAEDGNDSKAEGIRGDDEGPRSTQGGPWGFER